MQRVLRSLPLAAVLAVCFTGPRTIAADLTLRQTVETVRPPMRFGTPGTAVREQVLQVHGHLGRSVTRRKRPGAEPDQEVLIDFKRKLICEVDRKLRTYHLQKYERMRRMTEAIHDERAQQIQGLPDDTRIKERLLAAYDGEKPSRADLVRALKPGPWRDRMMKRFGVTENRVVYAVKETGQGRRICGKPCRQLVVLADGRPTGDEAWVTDKIAIEADVYEFLKLAKLIDPDLVDQMRKIKGIPLAYTVRWENGHVSRTTTEKVSREKLDPELFRIPPRGFRRVKVKPTTGR